MMEIKTVNAEDLSFPGGHYSHVNVVGDLAFLSGQLPLDKSGKVHADKSFKEQVVQVLDNIDACLRQLNTPRESLVQVRVYVVGMEHWKDFDVIYSSWIGKHRPSRAVVGVSELHFGALLEVEAVALVARK